MAHPDQYALQAEYYTYADYLEWDDGERVELIHGVPVLFATPNRTHQGITASLTAQLYMFLQGKPHKVYPAPFTVRLFEKKTDRPEDVDTVVEPDLCVVSDTAKLDDRGCRGAPDLIIEIVSPASRNHDRYRKFTLYQLAGVREYWIADPETKTIQAHVLKNGRYVTGKPAADTLSSAVLDGFTADIRAVFEE